MGEAGRPPNLRRANHGVDAQFLLQARDQRHGRGPVGEPGHHHAVQRAGRWSGRSRSARRCPRPSQLRGHALGRRHLLEGARPGPRRRPPQAARRPAARRRPRRAPAAASRSAARGQLGRPAPSRRPADRQAAPPSAAAAAGLARRRGRRRRRSRSGRRAPSPWCGACPWAPVVRGRAGRPRRRSPRARSHASRHHCLQPHAAPPPGSVPGRRVPARCPGVILARRPLTAGKPGPILLAGPADDHIGPSPPPRADGRGAYA